jgi:hypothetical protein
MFEKFILKAADISNLEFFKVISFQFLTMSPALQPLFRTVFKILTGMCVKIFFTDDLMSSTSQKYFPFSTLSSFGNSQKSAGAKL